VLVKRVMAATHSAGGIILPDMAQKRENEGEVLAVGPGGRDKDGNVIPMTVSVGDTVLLPEYGGHKFEMGDDEVFLFRNDDILGKFE
jgi:chaperonin GroES